ncbi:MAG TPA: hypothetical protein VF735_15715 [Pyrinomonadaceae bacterium]
MSIQDELHIPEQNERDEEQPQAQSLEKKKPFVEPEISAAINVFDATTFFLQGSQVGEDA